MRRDNGAECQRYVGVDRRQPRGLRSDLIGRRELLLYAAALVAIGALLPEVASRCISAEAARYLTDAVRVVGTALFFGAGLLWLARWRLTGEARMARAGTALMVLSLVAAPLAMLTGISSADPAPPLSAICHAAAVGGCILLLASALASPRVDSSLRPARAVITTISLAWVGIAGVALSVNLVEPAIAESVWRTGAELALACGWAACALWALRLGSRSAEASLTRLGLVLVVMAAVEGMQVVIAHPAPLAVAGLELVAASIVAANAARELGEIFAHDGNRLLSVAGALDQAHKLLVEKDELQEEQVHDARSAIAALRAAALTLERYGDRVDDVTQRSLRSSIVSELSRLERLIDPARPSSATRFSVEDALWPVIMAERQAGLVVHASVGVECAHGRAHDVARVVQTLLVNAQRYAPGSDVWVRAERAGREVRIHVVDRGPGLPSTEHESIFLRGSRGSTAEGGSGSGLGLYVARKLMAAQGGTIGVQDRPGGGADFVVTLPAASAEKSVENGVEHR